MTHEEQEKAQKKYVEARIEGKTGEEAKKIAGYAKGYTVGNLQATGGAVDTLMAKTLKEKGITEEFLAEKYIKGLELAYSDGAREKDVNGAAQLLKQLGYLLGYGRREVPSVAVQINNGPSGPVDDPGTTRELIAEIAGLVEVLQVQVGKDQQHGVHAGDSGAANADAHTGMVEPSGQASPSGGGGGA